MELEPIYRGRNLSITIKLTDNTTGQPFALETGDELRIGFKSNLKNTSYLLSGTLEADSDNPGVFYKIWDADQTESLVGDMVFWDVGLERDGDYYTIIAASAWEVREPVTRKAVTS